MGSSWAKAAVAIAACAALSGVAVPVALAGAEATAGYADKKLGIEGFAQVRWQYDHIGERGQIGSFDQNYFRLRRLRLRVTGDWNEHFRVRVQLALQEFARLFADVLPGEGGQVLEDAYMQYTQSDAFAILLGQFKMPISREELRSSSDQLVVDRSPVVNSNFSRSLWIARDVGVMVQGNFYGHDIPLEYYAGVWNGEGKNNPFDFRDLNDGKVFGGRAEYAILPGVEIAGSYLANPILSGGIYSYGASRFVLPEEAGYTEWTSVWGADGNFTRQFTTSRLIVEGEVLQGTNTRVFARDVGNALADGSSLPTPGDAGYTQRGMQVSGNMLWRREGALKGWEIGGRLADYDPDVDADQNSQTELAVAVGFHILGDPELNKDRLQLEFTNIFNERENTADDWSVKAQWQIRY